MECGSAEDVIAPALLFSSFVSRYSSEVEDRSFTRVHVPRRQRMCVDLVVPSFPFPETPPLLECCAIKVRAGDPGVREAPRKGTAPRPR